MAGFKSGDEWTGNRNGRPKKPPPPPPVPPPPDVKTLARQHGVKALQALIDVLDSEKATIKDKMLAANSILDRGYGKPQQIVEATLSTFERMTEAQLLEFLTGRPMIEPDVIDITPDESESEAEIESENEGPEDA